MKSIHITLEEREYEALIKAKGHNTWKAWLSRK